MQHPLTTIIFMYTTPQALSDHKGLFFDVCFVLDRGRKGGYSPGEGCGGKGRQVAKEDAHHAKRGAEQQADAQRRQQAHVCTRLSRGCKDSAAWRGEEGYLTNVLGRGR